MNNREITDKKDTNDKREPQDRTNFKNRKKVC